MSSDDHSPPSADLREPLQRETVADVGYRDLVSCGIDATVGDAVRLMQQRDVGCIVVLERGSLRGIFTERDVVTRVLGKVASDSPLRDCMTPKPTTVRVDDPIHRALTLMLQGGMRHLPVLDAQGQPVGTMSVKRAVHFVAEYYPHAVLNVAPDPELFPDTREGG